jgi:hypothetical protein
MPDNTVLSFLLGMLTTFVWIVTFGLLLAQMYPKEPEGRHLFRAAMLATLPAWVVFRFTIWITYTP